MASLRALLLAPAMLMAAPAMAGDFVDSAALDTLFEELAKAPDAATAEAIDCAITVQQGFARYNRGNAEPLHIRIGLDCGEPVEDSNDLFGSTVQLAARLCSAASRDQILVSANIHRECGCQDILEPLKPRRLKGFSQAVQSFQCAWSAG